MTRFRGAALLGFAVAILSACGAADHEAPVADRAFAALQTRGAEAMGVDQYTSSHIFEALPDGGRIVLQRDTEDQEGTATIRAHLTEISTRFAAGDFTIPGFVHAQTVPGTDVMAAKASLISYVADTIPRGGQVRVTSSDPEAIEAIHAFLAFQRHDHRASGH